MREGTCLLLIVLAVLFENSGSVSVNSLQSHEKVTNPHSIVLATVVKTKSNRFLRSRDMTDENDSEQRTGVGQFTSSVKGWARNTKLSRLIKSKFTTQEAKAKALVQSDAKYETLYKEKISPDYSCKALGFGDDIPYKDFTKLAIEEYRSFVSRTMQDVRKSGKFKWWEEYERYWHQSILNKRFSNKT